MSLRIKPVITQACYIIGCSKKLKNVSETRWIWNVPLFINTLFFFSAAILVPFPNTLLLKRIITVQKQKVMRIKVLAAGGWIGGLCLHVGLGSPPVSAALGVRVAGLCQFLQGLLLVSFHGEWQWWGKGDGGVDMCGEVISRPSQLWKLILYTVFPSFLITQLITIVISPIGTASLEATVSPHAHTLSSSPSFLSHSAHPMPFPTPSLPGPTGKERKDKKENN